MTPNTISFLQLRKCSFLPNNASVHPRLLFGPKDSILHWNVNPVLVNDKFGWINLSNRFHWKGCNRGGEKMSRIAPGEEGRGTERKRHWQREQGVQEGKLGPLVTNLSAPQFPQGLVSYLATKSWSFIKQSLSSILPSNHVNQEWEPEIKMKAGVEDAGMCYQDPSLGMKDHLFPAAGTATSTHPQPSAPFGDCLSGRKLPDQNRLSFTRDPTSNSAG